MREPAEQRLHDAIEAYVREVNEDSRIVTDFVMVAVSVSPADSEDVTTYTVAAPGPMHSGIGLATYGLDVLRAPDYDDD